MVPQTYETTPTRFVEANGVRYAYRRLGKESGTPMLCLQHFRGTLDNWDPAVVNGLANDRPVILFDNTGIARSGGQTPNTVAQMARHALAVIQALGLRQVDLLGFSLGGFVAQQVTLDRPDLIRRVILVGTGPQGGEGFAPFSPEVQAVAARDVPKPEDLLVLFFAPTETSQAAGRAFLGRLGARKEDREPPSTSQVRDAQLAAIHAWGTPHGERYGRLREIKNPVLVVNGMHDAMIPTINAYILAQHLPNAQLILYPNAGHGSLFQYPELFVEHASLFLRG